MTKLLSDAIDSSLHGTTTGYARGCRCAECKGANRNYYREYRRRCLATPLEAGDPRHGVTGYNRYGCRCPICTAASTAAKRLADSRMTPEARSARQRKAHFRRLGLTEDRFTEILEAQGGACAICRLPLLERAQQHVDHDHSCCPGVVGCGRCIRGILCSWCNPALGGFRDDADLLRAAIAYLEVR